MESKANIVIPASWARRIALAFLIVLPKLIAAGRAPAAQARLDLLDPRRVELAAERHQPLQHGRSRIGLHGVIDPRQRQGATQRAEILRHAIDVDDQARRRRLALNQETGDLGGHRAGPPYQNARLRKAAGGVDETVERTSDQTIARTLDVVA